MPKHFKTHMISSLNGIVSHYVPHSEISATHARGVRYCVFVDAIKMYVGKINTFDEGRKHKAHIIARAWHGNRAVYQIYTYHFPKTWSAACVANRELIKEAQRRAHALEHDHSRAALEWRTRFLHHYFRVFRCGEDPEPGLKRYSRFYQYTYVVIYRELKAAQQQALQAAQNTEIPLPPLADEVSFDPIDHRPLRTLRSYPLQRALNARQSLFSLSCEEGRSEVSRSFSSEALWRDFCKIET